MTTTQSLLDVLPRVVRLSDIKLIRGSGERASSSISRIWGCDIEVAADDLDTNNPWFLTRIDVLFFKKEPERWSSGDTRNKAIGITCHTLEEIPALINGYLDAHPEYFKTFTDEWGRTYGAP